MHRRCQLISRSTNLRGGEAMAELPSKCAHSPVRREEQRKVFDGLPLPDHLRHVAVDKIRHHYSRPARLPLLLLSVFF